MNAGTLSGRIAVITGAATGLGREYALLFAREGAQIVVNDLQSADPGTPLAALVDQIRAEGGAAVACAGDITDEQVGPRLVETAVDAFGGLDVLVNNAGAFLEGPLIDTSLPDLTALLNVNLAGHFLPTRAAARYWRDVSSRGGTVRASVITTTSRSALRSIAEHGAYAAAKAAVVTFSMIAAKELEQFGVRVNCVAPFARTRMTESISLIAGSMGLPAEPGAFDPFEPANVAPLMAYLAMANCPISGELLFGHGGTVQRYDCWVPGKALDRDGAWTVEELVEQVPSLGLD